MAVQSTLNRRQRRGTLATVLAVAAAGTAAFQGVSFVTAPALENGTLRAPPQLQHVARFARGGADDIEMDFGHSMISSLSSLKPGQELQGVVTKVLDKVAIVDVGLEKEGFVPVGKCADGQVTSPSDVVKEGQDVRVWVVEATVSDNERENKLVLSMSKRKIVDFRSLGVQVDCMAFKDVSEDTWLEGVVVNDIDAGIIVSVPSPEGEGQATGLVTRRSMKGQPDILEKVKVRVESVSEGTDGKNSRMSLTMLPPPISLEVFKDAPDWMEGTIVNAAAFGSFVSVPAPDGNGEAQGLIPGRELQGNPQPGDKVQVRIFDLDLEKNKISLSMKHAPGEAPEMQAFKEIAQDVWIDGKVQRMEDFGAFIQVTPPGGGQTAEGLLHISEIRDGERVEDPAEEFELGQDIKVRVISVDDKGLSLSMKKPAATAPAPAPAPAPAEA